jgi:hypothetical protein
MFKFAGANGKMDILDFSYPELTIFFTFGWNYR